MLVIDDSIVLLYIFRMAAKQDDGGFESAATVQAILHDYQYVYSIGFVCDCLI
jgi:hypothetical protein